MTFSEVIGAIEAHVKSYSGWDFIVSTRNQVNTYFTGQALPSKALVMLDPPTYSIPDNVGGVMPKRYDVRMAFMMHIEQDSSYLERQNRVNIADQYASDFLVALNENAQEVGNFDGVEISNIEVFPEHLFKYNAQHMSGVFLSFDLMTEDTFNYCQVLNEDFPDPVIRVEFTIWLNIEVSSYSDILTAIFAAEGDMGVTFIWEERLVGEESWEVFNEQGDNSVVVLDDLPAGEYEFRMRYRSDGGSLSGYSNTLTKTLS